MKLLDYSKFCLYGIDFLDGQHIDGFEACVSYGVIIHECVDIDKMNYCLQKLYQEIDCFHMRISEDGEYVFDKNIKEQLHFYEAEGRNIEEKISFVRQHVIKRSEYVRNRHSQSPFYCELFKLEENEFFLCAYLDRYVSDGHSIGVALMKLLGSYKDVMIPEGVSVKSLRDYIESIDTPDHEQKALSDAKYWREHLDGYKINKYAPVSSTPAFTEKNIVLNLPKESYVAAAKALKTTLGNLLTGAYHLAVCEVFRTVDNVISYVSTDRNSLDEWGIIGPFVKPLNSRVVIDFNDTLQAFIKKVAKESGDNLRHKDAHIDDIKINRYGMLFLNHSKPFLKDEVYTQWMPDLYMDRVEADFIYARMQELADTIEISFVCNRNRICKEHYEAIADAFIYYLKALCMNFDKTIDSIMR